MSAALNLGDTVGRWRLESLLGEGGMARVYLGVDAAGGQVALKVMTGSLEHAELVGRFEQEARLLMRLRHPHLVQVLDAGRVGAAPWMAMECLAGRPIGALIRQHGGLELAVAMPLLAQLADALAALHAAGVVHRDVKPANVMVSAEGWVTLLDLGIARSGESALTRTGVMYGTPGYMAPEQILGERDIRPAADVYAFAVMAWRMLTGEAPFRAKGEALLVEHLRAKRPCLAEVRPGLPAGLTPVFERALAVDPAARYPHLGALWEELELALEGTGHSPTVRHQLETLPLNTAASTAHPESSRGGTSRDSAAHPESSRGGTSRDSARASAAVAVQTSSTVVQLAPVARRPTFDDQTAPAGGALALPLPEVEPEDSASTRASLRAVDDRSIREWARAARVLSIIAAVAVLLVVIALLSSHPAEPPPPTPMSLGRPLAPVPPAEPEAPEADLDILARREGAAKLASAAVPVSRSGYSRDKVREYAPRSVRHVTISNGGGQPRIEIIALVGGRKVRAEVDIDGVRAGTTPVIVPVNSQRHSVRVEAPPNPPSRFEIGGGQSMRLEVELVPLGAEEHAKVATPF